MKKKALAILAALTVMAMGAMTVFAAESPSVNDVETAVSTQKAETAIAATSSAGEYAEATTVSAGYTKEAVSDTTLSFAKVAVQNQLLNDVAAIGEKLGDSTLKAAATDSAKKVTATILSVIEVKVDSAQKNADGKYEVTLSIAGIAQGDSIAVLHYNGSAWETIVPSKVAAGAITFTTESFSPFAVVKLESSTTTTGSTGQTTTTGTTGTTTSTGSSASATAAAGTVTVASPKTGQTMPFAVILVAAGFVGAAVCAKKYFA